jgi:hypothetical protein
MQPQDGNTPRITVPLEEWPRIREVRPPIDIFSEGGKLCFLWGEEEPAASEVMRTLPHDDSHQRSHPSILSDQVNDAPVAGNDAPGAATLRNEDSLGDPLPNQLQAH